jgi:hypothetical protein
MFNFVHKGGLLLENTYKKRMEAKQKDAVSLVGIGFYADWVLLF